MYIYDETLQEWVDDGESEAVNIPPRPPENLMGVPVGPREGRLTSKGIIAKATMPTPPPVAYEEPSGPSAQIVGYGKRLMLQKPGAEEWLTPSGETATPEYIKDVQDTMGALDRGEMSDTQLTEKIRSQEGQPPGRKPTKGDLNIVSFVNDHMKEQEPELRKKAAEAGDEYERSISYSTRSLKEDQIGLNKAALIDKRFNDLWNEEKTLTTKHAERLQRIEDAKQTPKTTTDLIRESIRDKTGKNPTASEILSETSKFNAESMGAREKAKTEAKGTFKDWTPEAKEQEFTLHMISGKPPVSAAGLGGGDRQQYGKEYAQWKTDKGIRPQDVGLMQADFRSGDMSLRNMAKQEAPMEAFVGNINRQIDKVKQLYDNNDRTGLRLIDMPVRELKMRAVGSGDEAVKASYLLEISNEIGKLSSGSSASVQQLSDSAKEDWKRVHDPNLSLGEIMKVVNATRDQANMRLETWKSAKQTVRSQIKSIGELEGGIKPANESYAPERPKFIIKKVR
jgi:hypothetical protein